MENDFKQANQPAFEKLDGVSNFGTWKFQMTMYLKLEDLWSCIEIPEGGVVDPKKDIKALARISLALKSTCIQYVRTAKTAKAAWDALCGVFEDKGFYRRVMLLRQLHQASYSNFNTMDNYIEYIMNLVHQLADIGRTIDDQEVAELLLSGLPQEYDIVVSSLESATVSKNLTSELVRTRLLQEEHRHVKAKCYKYKKNKKQESATEQAFVATHQCLSTANSSEWLLDSGATAHMSNDLKWFSNIKKCKQTVTVANGATLTCYGRGEEQTRSDLGVKDDASVLQSSHDVDAALVSSELWHKRLGHLSHRGVRPPSKVLQRPMMMETMRSEQTL
ncbi:gag-polypeptide of LTR copia-type domain-containing protein [Phthorimaea operculella]|nr:gag-polypeptide of LTR copia-type domain-containing protein [Phthorimaea operculella]